MFKFTRKIAGMAVVGAVFGCTAPHTGQAADEASWIERKKIAGFQVVSKGNEPEGYTHTSLRTLEKNPRFYMDRKISFDMYYGSFGTIYQPFPTGFHKGDWTNFYAWDINTQLWNQEQKRDICTTLYIHRENTETTSLLEKVDQYTPIRVYGMVVNDHDGLPWIEVQSIQVINEPLISPAVLRQLEDAYKQVANNNIDAASEDYKKALEMGVPVRVQVLVNRSAADIYLRDRKFAQAMTALNRVIELVPGDVTARLKLARLQLRMGMEMGAGEEASALFAMALENSRAMTYSYPNNPEGYAVYGLALAYNGRMAEAVENEKFADERTTTGLAEAHANLARIAMLRAGGRDSAKEVLNDFDDANKEYMRATIQDPVNADYRLEHARVLVKLAASDSHLYADAIEEYKLFAKFAPKSPIGYAEQADAVMKENAAGAPQKAIALHQKAIQADAHYVHSYAALADLYMHFNADPAVLKPDYDRAKGVLTEGIQNNPYAGVLYKAMRGVGVILKDDKYLTDAAARYIEKVGDADSYVFAGLIKYEDLSKQDVVGALQSFRTANAMDSGNMDARKYIGRIYVRTYELGGAVHDLMAPAYEANKTDVEFLLDWAESCLGVQDFTAAAAAATSVAEQAPSDWRAQNLMVRVKFATVNCGGTEKPSAAQLQEWYGTLDQGQSFAGNNATAATELLATRSIIGAHYGPVRADARSGLERYLAGHPNDTTAALAYSIVLIAARDYGNANVALGRLVSRGGESEISALDRFNIQRAAAWRDSIATQVGGMPVTNPTQTPVTGPTTDPNATQYMNNSGGNDMNPSGTQPAPTPADPGSLDNLLGDSASSAPAPQPTQPAPQPAPQPVQTKPLPAPTPAPQPTQPKPTPAPTPAPQPTQPKPTPAPTPAPQPTQPKPTPAPTPAPQPSQQKDPQDMLDDLLNN